jgi:hypothetical protein
VVASVISTTALKTLSNLEKKDLKLPKKLNLFAEINGANGQRDVTVEKAMLRNELNTKSSKENSEKRYNYKITE